MKKVLPSNRKYHDGGSFKTSVFIPSVQMWLITFKTNYNKRLVKKYFVLKTLEYDICFIKNSFLNKSVFLCVWHINV